MRTSRARVASVKTAAVGLLVLWLAGPSASTRGADPQPDERPASGSQAAFMADRGLVRHEGRWRTSQEILIRTRRAAAAAAEREWATRLDRLRQECDDPARSSVAIETIREIDDPFAVAALSTAVTTDPLYRARSWYLEALSRIGTPQAVSCLAAIALDHVDPETRIAAVERLAVERPPLARAAFLQALAGPDNSRINRAAEALGRLGDPDAVLPLVSVLITEHVSIDPGNGGGLSATFTPGQGGLSAGGGPTHRRTLVRNEAVLEALVRLTGQNFEWQPDAWRAWLASQQSPSDFDPRRG